MGLTGSGSTLRAVVSGILRGLLPATVIVTLLALAGCTPTPVRVAPAWSRVVLPQDVEPVTLAASGSGVLVGGYAATAAVRPRMLLVAPDGSRSAIPLIPHSSYAAEARWESIASDGRRVIAVGGAPGGAHSNTRWTTWTGNRAGLAESPQPFDTFGGWGAGDLLGPVLTSAGPVIAGSWAGARSGLDAAIWLPAGDRWRRASSAGTALESTPTLQVGPRAVTSTGTGIMLAGSALHLSGGRVRQVAAVWRSARGNTGWARADLPGSGAAGEAVSATCQRKDCVVAGYVDHVVALWRLDPAAAVRISAVPRVTVTSSSPVPAPLVAGVRIIEVVSAGPRVVVLDGGDRPWTLTSGPAGQATGSALLGGWLYVISKSPAGSSVLWRCRLKDLG